MGLFSKFFGGKKEDPNYKDVTEDYQDFTEEKSKEDIATEGALAAADIQEESLKAAISSLPNIPPLDLMKVNYVNSPNKSARRGDVKYLVLHHTGPGSFNGIVKWLTNPAAKASAHYVVGKNGELAQLVNTGKEAWHAGRAKWDGARINNHCSVGVEICNHGILEKEDDGNYYYEQGRQTKRYTGKTGPVPAKIIYPSGATLEGYAVPYPEKQIKKLVALCKAIIEKYPAITRENVLTHFEIGFPEGRKNDPFGLDMEYVKDLIFNT